VPATVTYNAAPGPATLVAPSGTVNTSAPTFTWKAVSDAISYVLWSVWLIVAGLILLF